VDSKRIYEKGEEKVAGERDGEKGELKNTVPSRLPSQIGASRVNPSKLRINRSGCAMVRIKTGMIVTRGWQVVELWFGGGACSCKSGAKAPHSKLGRVCGMGQYTGKRG
jgi:hypothetical protein